MTKIDPGDFVGFFLFGTWVLLGGLHLIAWSFHFPTKAEKIAWRVASLVLVAGPLVFFTAHAIFKLVSGLVGRNMLNDYVNQFMADVLVVLGVVARMLLVALMLASLRSLPPSAYHTVPWTGYIPHL